MSKTKAVMKINNSSLETGCDVCLQRLSYKSTKKINKNEEAQKPNYVFQKKHFQKS